jgi:microcystin-dependent protein
MVGFNFAPRGWAFCDGQILPINQNQSLYSLLGTTYGGDGRTTFALPDMRGRVPIHVGSSDGGAFHTLGQKNGEEIHTLSAAEMPQHQHAWRCTTEDGDDVLPMGKLLGSFNNAYRNEQDLTEPVAGTILNVGGSQGHDNMQPYLALYFCIALQGLFPSRN